MLSHTNTDNSKMALHIPMINIYNNKYTANYIANYTDYYKLHNIK